MGKENYSSWPMGEEKKEIETYLALADSHIGNVFVHHKNVLNILNI
jgi:hypothetical protein